MIDAIKTETDAKKRDALIARGADRDARPVLLRAAAPPAAAVGDEEERHHGPPAPTTGRSRASRGSMAAMPA